MPSYNVLRADFHIHSYFSADSNMSPEKIVKVAKEKGLDVIAVTDHNSIRGGLEVKKIAKNLIVFVGAEIKTNEGEVIGINLKKDIEPFLSLVETCELIKKQGALVFVPHPFDAFRDGVGKAIEKINAYIDAVEVFNARVLLKKFNREAYNFAKAHNLPFFAGSDAHFESEIGAVYMLINAKKDENDILKAIKERKVEINGEKTGIKPHWKTFVTKMSKKI